MSIALFYSSRPMAGWGSAAVFLIIFAIVAVYHRRIDQRLSRYHILVQIKSSQIAQMELDWAHIAYPMTAESLTAHDEHPFESDLDLVGKRSLHQLITTAVSRDGNQRLRDWLTDPLPDFQRIRQRQALVRELAPLYLFRDKLLLSALLASKHREDVLDGKRLLGWINQQAPSASLKSMLLVLSTLAGLTDAGFLLSRVAHMPPFWIITFLLYAGLFLGRKEIGSLFEEAYALKDGLNQLSAVLHFLETYPYGKHQELKNLCAPFLRERERRPSTQLRRIAGIAAAATLQKNRLFWLIVNAIVPWDFYFAYRLQQSKVTLATLLPGWLEVWVELEALVSLANFSYVNPDYVFPEVASVESGGVQVRQSILQVGELAHPLLPDEKNVANDFTLNKLGEIVIITGSNMSGKSTFLRTIGINLCLANAGGPVRAKAFRTSLFRVFTCIKVSDSVTDGYSYFYAEVKRLKALLDELQRPDPVPLLFLIDEIFKGTNNRERLLGSRSYLRALVGSNGVGVITTHDLELVQLAEENTRITNYHFRDEVKDSRLEFDYTLRPGPSPTTNALKIMSLEGLPVEWPAE